MEEDIRGSGVDMGDVASMKSEDELRMKGDEKVTKGSTSKRDREQHT